MPSETSIRAQLLARIDREGVGREAVIDSVVGELPVGRIAVESTLSELERQGEVYVVDGEVRRV